MTKSAMKKKPLPKRPLAAGWKKISRGYDEILYHHAALDGGKVAKLTINRPEVHNAFTPKTVQELRDALAHARDQLDVGVIVLTGAGDKAFCSGGDQRVRKHGGYVGGKD